ncbi:MATE family efflux transporter [Ruminococcaceae bacterium OttesenSCG-928-L11]|nr:MATE family efflux transporter [Ruminococcaceae bacterium OttesenSCG-928-L11]
MNNSLTQGKVSSILVKFAMPFIIANLLQSMYGAADLFVVGQYSNSAAVSGVAIGSQVMQTITAIIQGISLGSTVLIAQSIGSGNHNKAAKGIGTSAVAFAVLAVLIAVAMFFCIDLSINLMQTPVEALEETRNYIFICTCGIPFIVGYNVVSSIFRGLGDSTTPVVFIAIAAFVNIVTDFVLVGQFHMSASGAAIATVAAQAISFIASLIYMAKKGFAFPVRRSDFRIDKESLLYILKVGVPVALQNSLVNISFLVITAIINTMGLIASAAVGVVEKLMGFMMLPASSFSSAVATITAQNIGAGKPERASKSLQFGILFSLVWGVLICVYSNLLPETLTGLFSKDAAVVTAAADYLRIYSFDCILVAFVFCLNSYFTGCGNSVLPMVHSLISTFLVRIPMSYVLSRMEGAGLFEIGFAAPLASLFSLIICLFYFIYKKKRGNPIVESE